MRFKKRRANVRAPAMAAGDTDGTPPLRRMLGNQLMSIIIVVFFKQSWTAKTRAQFSPDHFIGYKLLMSGRLQLGVLDSANTSIDFSRLPKLLRSGRFLLGVLDSSNTGIDFLRLLQDC